MKRRSKYRFVRMYAMVRLIGDFPSFYAAQNILQKHDTFMIKTAKHYVCFHEIYHGKLNTGQHSCECSNDIHCQAMK